MVFSVCWPGNRPGRDHWPGFAEGSRITCVAISFWDQLCIRCAAVFEYGSEGKGVLKDGGGGSCSESAGTVGVLVAQLVRNTVQAVKLSAQKRFTVTGGIEGSLVGLGDRALVGAGLGDSPQTLVRLLQAHVGHGGIHAGVLEDPGASGGRQGHGQVGDEGEVHRALPSMDSVHRASGTLPSRLSAQPTMNMGLFRLM